MPYGAKWLENKKEKKGNKRKKAIKAIKKGLVKLRDYLYSLEWD